MRFPSLNLIRSFGTLALTALLASVPAKAQDLGDSLITAALGVSTATTGTADPAVFISWWPTGSTAWTPGHYAVYRKEGLPSDAASFSLVGVVQPLTDPVSVGYVLSRAELLGSDTIALANNIDGLFDALVPVSGLPLSEKLAAIIEVSSLDADSAENLTLLTRRHPAAAMAAGVGFVDTVSAGTQYTYEIRECPQDAVDSGDCQSVSGRIVITGGTVNYLPAPGQPVEVPFADNSPRGNLNVPLRWSTPDSLRERAFFQFGYDLYRVSADLAVDRGWDAAVPNRTAFIDALALGPSQIERVNDLPILTDELFDAAAAANLVTDPETFFYIDDNRRFEDGGIPFMDGDQFYYFVAGRDLLGRPGEISAGTPVTICFRMPPQAPRRLKVSNDYSWDAATDTQTQVFHLEWDAAQTRENGPEIAGYWIYRWSSIQEMQDNAGLPYGSLPGGSMTGGRIATVSSATTAYTDETGVHPFITYSRDADLRNDSTVNHAEAGKTYWYSVRAIDASACGGNVSGNSAPAFGVLRDRVGPAAPSGSIATDCEDPLLSVGTTRYTTSADPYNSNLVYLKLNATRINAAIEWIDFYVSPLDEQAYIGRFYFDSVSNDVSTTVLRRTQVFVDAGLTTGKILARVGTSNGSISDIEDAFFLADLDPEKNNSAYVQTFDFVAAIDQESDCEEHDPNPSGGLSGTVEPLEIVISLTEGSEEWKLYRSVNGGPMTMIQQGLKSFDPADYEVTIEHYNFPLNGGRVCYYAQLFDQHGQGSSMIRLGCVEIAPRTPLPQPMLSPVTPVGTDPDNGAANIEWFCAPAGVERFELWIRSDNSYGPTDLSDELRLRLPPAPNDQDFWSLHYDSTVGEIFRAYYTGRVGTNFDAGPEYDVLWNRNLESGLRYHIRVRAVGANGHTSPWSNEESFIWSAEIDFSVPFDTNNCVVPWPMLGLPEVNDAFTVTTPASGYEVGLKAVFKPTDDSAKTIFEGAAIRVGMVSTGNLDVQFQSTWEITPGYRPENGFFQLPRGAETNLDSAFYQTTDGESLLNFAVYRYQVPNDTWPKVSGDVYQVSPLIDALAAEPILYGADKPAWAVHDPYFFLIEIAESQGSTPTYDLYLKDTQPVIVGASYRYLVVRFDDLGEIVQIIPLEVLDTF